MGCTSTEFPRMIPPGKLTVRPWKSPILSRKLILYTTPIRQGLCSLEGSRGHVDKNSDRDFPSKTHDSTGTNCAKPDRRCGQVLWDLQMHSNVASVAKIAFKNPRKLWISYDFLIGEGGKHHHRASEPPPLVLSAAQRQVKTSLARQFCDRTVWLFKIEIEEFPEFPANLWDG